MTGNAAWLFFDNGLRAVIGFPVLAWMAQYLGPGRFGELNYSIAVVSIFSFLAALGVNDIIVRESVRNPHKTSEILSTALFLKFFGGAIAFLLASFTAFFLPGTGDLIPIFLINIIAFGFIFQAFDVFDAYFQSRLQSRYSVLAKIVAFLLASSVRIILILAKAPLLFFAGAVLLENIVTAIALFSVFSRYGTGLRRIPSFFPKAIIILKSSWPIMLSTFGAMVYMRIDQILVRQMISAQALGFYSVAVRISEMFYMIGAIIITTAFPVIVGIRAQGNVVYYKKIAQFYCLLLSIGIFSSLIISFFSEQIVRAAFGMSFLPAAQVLSVHIWSVTFVFLGGATSSVMIVEELQKYNLFRVLVGAGAGILLNLWLIPLYGILGAAVASISAMFISVLSTFFFKKTRKILFLNFKKESNYARNI